MSLAMRARTTDGPGGQRFVQAYVGAPSPRLREQAVLSYQPLVRSIASRFVDWGEPLEDLVQVGNVGLLRAMERYDPALGVRFSTFVTPAVAGEIRRHFRDRVGLVKVPRWLQERQQAARRAAERLAGALGRSPSAAEVAAHLGLTEEQVLEALECGEATNLRSLDAPLAEAGPDPSGTLQDLVGRADAALEGLAVRADLRAALDSLKERERAVVALRYLEEMSQREAAGRLGVSQMQVSRLEKRALARLRDRLRDAG